MSPKRISVMPQQQFVIISPQSAFIFQCPWFIQRQCAGSLPPPYHHPHPPPLLSMISAALCRSVQIESEMDENVASRVGGLPSPAISRKIPPAGRAKTETGRQAVRWVWQCVLAVPHPSSGSEWLLLNSCCTCTPCTAPVC